LYAAMDWLLERQDNIEKKLAARHLKEGGLVLYDLSSSYFEGSKCPLAKLGHSRDGVKGKPQVNYGLLTDARGCPVSVSVFDGNVGDPKTLLPAVDKVRGRFGIHELVLVGDRGMISQKQIDALEKMDGVAWITALKTGAIRKLVNDECIQLGLFDERNLFECEHPDFPGERLVACRNPDLAKLRAHKRQSLLDATAKELEKVRGMVGKGKLKNADAIGVRVGKVVNKYKVAKHFVLDIGEDTFSFRIDDENVKSEAALDGIYVVRTSVPKASMSEADAVRSYKLLSQVERAFRSLKSVTLKVRPIFHHDENRVRAHIFLCMLAYYIEWHMREALRGAQVRPDRRVAAPSGQKRHGAGNARCADAHAVHRNARLRAARGAMGRNRPESRALDCSGRAHEVRPRASPAATPASRCASEGAGDADGRRPGFVRVQELWQGWLHRGEHVAIGATPAGLRRHGSRLPLTAHGPAQRARLQSRCNRAAAGSCSTR
jgi:hypothetical protein